MKKNTRDWIYILVLLLTVLTILSVRFYISSIDKFVKLPECIIYKKFGAYCPGCGATRAVYSLYSGQILQSLYYNSFILYLIIIDFLYLLTEGISKILRRENKFFIKNINLYIWLGVIILILNWIIKIFMWD